MSLFGWTQCVLERSGRQGAEGETPSKWRINRHCLGARGGRVPEAVRVVLPRAGTLDDLLAHTLFLTCTLSYSLPLTHCPSSWRARGERALGALRQHLPPEHGTFLMERGSERRNVRCLSLVFLNRSGARSLSIARECSRTGSLSHTPPLPQVFSLLSSVSVFPCL